MRELHKKVVMMRHKQLGENEVDTMTKTTTFDEFVCHSPKVASEVPANPLDKNRVCTKMVEFCQWFCAMKNCCQDCEKCHGVTLVKLAGFGWK